jgi:hypothetical protein
MPEEAIKKRLRKAKTRASSLLQASNHTIISLGSPTFDFLALRKREIRLIAVLIDEPTKERRQIMREFSCPEYCTKEIWIKQFDSNEFTIQEID